MVLILDGNSEHVAHVWRHRSFVVNIFHIWHCCWCKQMPYTDQTYAFTPHVRIVFWATILYNYHDHTAHYRARICNISFCCRILISVFDSYYRNTQGWPTWQTVHKTATNRQTDKEIYDNIRTDYQKIHTKRHADKETQTKSLWVIELEPKMC